MVRVGDNIIINADDLSEVEMAANTDMIVVSCGLKLNATVTASSIDDDGFTFCLQRAIYTVSHKTVLPQEFNVAWKQKPDDIFAFLAVVTVLLLCDISPEIFKVIEF